MAVTQRPPVLRRDLIRIFSEDRLVAVVRTATSEAAELAARAMARAGVRLVEITLTVPDAYELIAALATDDEFAAQGAIVGAGTVLSGAQAEDAFITNVRRALQHLPLVATGNVEYDEIPAYFKAGVVGFGIGGPLIRPDLLERRDTDGVVANAKRFLSATRRA